MASLINSRQKNSTKKRAAEEINSIIYSVGSSCSATWIEFFSSPGRPGNKITQRGTKPSFLVFRLHTMSMSNANVKYLHLNTVLYNCCCTSGRVGAWRTKLVGEPFHRSHYKAAKLRRWQSYHQDLHMEVYCMLEWTYRRDDHIHPDQHSSGASSWLTSVPFDGRLYYCDFAIHHGKIPMSSRVLTYQMHITVTQ